MIGSVLGQFRIVEQVGAGGMGVVYRARDERLRRDVAIKVLPSGVLSDEVSRRNFHREAVALSRLNHPGIATIYDFQTVEGTDFLVMEFVSGESLDHRLARGPLPEDEIVSLGLQLAEGLAEAHRQGIVHRDLKPGNLKITPEGRLKILDFGLARWLAPDADSPTITTTTSQVVVGTPAYLAPELLQGARADERTDLYGAGLVLYQAATGSLPFPGLTAGAMLAAIVHQKPPAPRTRNPRISSGLEAVILRCLEKEPGRRYPSAAELAGDLRALSGGSGRRLPFPRAGRRTVPALAVALIIVGAALGVLMWRSGWPGRPAEAARIQSLAVLPLGNLSGDLEQEYFADGMTEALIAELSHVRALRVTSLTSVMRYKERQASMPQIARELGVDGVVEGNIAKAHDRLRTTVHLIAAREDQQLWSGQYDGDTLDVLGLQSRVARAIVGEIQVRLTRAERARLKEKGRTNPAAYQDYLKGRYQWNRRTDGGIRLAIDYFGRAIARDSMFALAHAGLADAWAAAGLYGLTPPLEARRLAQAAAARAVAIDPDLAAAHTSLAHVLHNFDWNWDEAEREYRRAIALNPSDVTAHHFYAHLLAQQGRFEEAHRSLRLAQALDPLSLPIVLAGASHEYFARRYDRALEVCRHAAELDSSSSLLHRLRAGILDRQGREREAVLELARSFELRGQPEVAAGLTRAYDAAGMRGALELLIGGTIRKRAEGVYQPAEHIAELYARLGRVDEAFRWLEVSLREHDTELNRLKVDPIFDPLRSDARFAELLRRVHLDRVAPPS